MRRNRLNYREFAVPQDFDIHGFRNAAPYINAHRGCVFVITFGGEAIAADTFPGLIHDIALLHSMGVKLVLVHGARPQIEQRLRARRAEPKLHQGLRVTDKDALAAVVETVGCLRAEIEARLSMGLFNTPMSGMRINVVSGNFVVARPLGVRDGIDYEHTGEVRKIDTSEIRQQLELGNIVLLSPLGYSPTGEMFNISADDVATTTASALQADKLVFLTEGDGLRDSKRKKIRQLNVSSAKEMLEGRRKLKDTHRAWLESAVNASLSNVGRVHLLDRELDGALPREFFTRDGVGTLITAQDYEGARTASVDDVGGIMALIAPLEERGVLVRRSREQLELEINHFQVVERDGTIIACAALFPFVEDELGELACLATHPEYRNSGRANRLLDRLETVARAEGLSRLFVLTTQTAHWFIERGFTRGELKDLPMKRRELYNYQRNSKVFFKTLE